MQLKQNIFLKKMCQIYMDFFFPKLPYVDNKLLIIIITIIIIWANVGSPNIYGDIGIFFSPPPPLVRNFLSSIFNKNQGVIFSCYRTSGKMMVEIPK
jgi:hypothetical protein